MNDIPLGFLFSISQNNKAMNFYSSLLEHQKESISKYLQNCSSGEEAKEKLNTVINNLENNNLSFIDNINLS